MPTTTQAASSMLARLGLACVLMTAAGAATAQHEAPATDTQTVAPADLPDGFSLLEKHIEAVGGKEAVKKVERLRMNGTFTITAMGMTGDLLIQLEAPGKMAVVVELPGMGQIDQGTDGEVAWQSTMPGAPAQIVEGEPAEALKDQARFTDEYTPRETYESAVTIGKELFEDQMVYRVETKKKRTEAVSQSLYSVDTGLLLAEMKKSSPDAENFDLVTVMSDYRKVGDLVLMPHKMTASTPQFDQVIEMSAIEINPEFEAGTFDTPGSF